MAARRLAPPPRAAETGRPRLPAPAPAGSTRHSARSTPPSARSSGGGRHRRRRREAQVVLGVGIDQDAVAVLEGALQQSHRQRLDDALLNGALERTCTIDRVEALTRQQLFGGRGELELHLSLSQPLAQATKLDLDDAPDVVDAEWLEDHEFVDTVDQ